jgi:hypothetical protein
MTAEVSPCQLLPAETRAFCRVAPMGWLGGRYVGREGRERAPGKGKSAWSKG